MLYEIGINRNLSTAILIYSDTVLNPVWKGLQSNEYGAQRHLDMGESE